MNIYYCFLLFLLTVSQIFSQWEKENFAPSNDYLFCVYFVNENTGWISGGSNNEGYLYKTTDGGNSWSKTIFPETYELQSIFFINENSGWAVGDSGIVISTSDGGENWNYQNSGTKSYLSSVFFVDENIGWICYGYGEGFPSIKYHGVILHTTNGGQDWIIQKEVENYHFSCIYFIDNNYGWAAGVNHQNQTEIYLTSDGGKIWVPIEIETVWKSFYSIHFTDNSIGWLVGESGIIIKSTDGGNTWFQQTNGYKSYFLSACYSLDQNRAYSVGRYGTILWTTDGGDNWTEQESGSNKTLNSVFFIDNNRGWAVGYEGTVLKTNNGGITFVEENIDDKPKGFSISQNYPNPFNPGTKIQFTIPQQSFVTLTIYDVLGREVRQLVNNEMHAGRHTLNFDASNLSNGVYFYKVEAGNYVETKKMSLIK